MDDVAFQRMATDCRERWEPVLRDPSGRVRWIALDECERREQTCRVHEPIGEQRVVITGYEPLARQAEPCEPLNGIDGSWKR